MSSSLLRLRAQPEFKPTAWPKRRCAHETLIASPGRCIETATAARSARKNIASRHGYVLARLLRIAHCANDGVGAPALSGPDGRLRGAYTLPPAESSRVALPLVVPAGVDVQPRHGARIFARCRCPYDELMPSA